MKFQTHFTRGTRYYETSTLKSLTIPDQTMSVIEIMKRFARGESLGGAQPEFYAGEDDEQVLQNDLFGGRDPRSFDIEERAQMALDAKAKVDRVDLGRKAHKAKNDAKKRQLDIEEEARKLYEAQQQAGEKPNTVPGRPTPGAPARPAGL